MIDSYYDCKTCAYWLTEAMYQCQEKSCKQRFSTIRKYVSCPCTALCCALQKLNVKHIHFLPRSLSFNGEYKASNNGSSGGNGGIDIRTGRDSYEVPKCCDNIVKTPTELNSPMSRSVSRFRDEGMIECQFSVCGCNFRANDRSQLMAHNEENIHRHMNVSVCVLNRIRLDAGN